MLQLLLQILDWIRHCGRRRRAGSPQAAGARAEDIAQRYLQRRGYRVVARNFVPRSANGDLDLVAWDGDRLVIVEVKSRASSEYGDPGRAMDEDKRQALFRVGREYTRRAEIPWESVRFDLVSVVFAGRTRITHERDIYRPR